MQPKQTEHNQWSEQAHNAEIVAQLPTFENPVRFDVEDQVRSVTFSEVPGESLKGYEAGYYFNVDPQGNKERMSIIQLDEASRAKRAAEGFDGAEMIVPAGFIAPEKRNLNIKELEPVPLEEKQDMGATAIEAALTYDPTIEEHALNGKAADQVRAMRAAAHGQRMAPRQLSREEINAYSDDFETKHGLESSKVETPRFDDVVDTDMTTERETTIPEAVMTSMTTDEKTPAPEATISNVDATKKEIAGLPIEMQRAIRDYEMYMKSADSSTRVNGHNKDAIEDRQRADQRISILPSAMKDLAKRYYQEAKDS